MGAATAGRTAIRGVVVAAVLGAVMLLGSAARANGAGDLVGVVDPVTGEWHLRGPDGFTTSFYFGDPGDVPFLGDWDCDGDETPGLYRQSDGYVYLRNSSSQGIADVRFFFGNPGDVPLAGDFDGDGCDTVSIYRPSEARIYIINELGADDGGLGAADYFYDFGNPGDQPFVGDFDGDNTDTVGLHRASTGLVYYRNTNTTGIAEVQFVFGNPGDRIMAADWTGDGTDTVGLFRPSDARIYLRHTNTQGNADEAFDYGIARQVPVGGATGLAAVAVADRDWDVSSIHGPGHEWGRFASVGFGANGRPIISHGQEESPFAYQLALTRCGDLWCTPQNASTLSTPWRVSDHTSMTTGADGIPVWSFHDRTNLMLGRCTDTSCAAVSFTVVAPPDLGYRSGILSSTTIGTDGNPLIVALSGVPRVQVMRCGNPACTTKATAQLSTAPNFDRYDIAIGPDQLPVVTFMASQAPPFELFVRHCTDPGCATGSDNLIDSWDDVDDWTYTSFATGDGGKPIVAYNDSLTALVAGVCGDVACASVTTETIEPGAVSFVSAGNGGDGLPFIAFREGGALKVAHCDDLACSSSTVTTVDPGPGVGEFASLATDPYGMPVVAYFDRANGDLKVARLGS